MDNRNSVIIKTSVIGILANVILAGSKAVFGLFANSIAIVLDAVNNLSDALASVITIVGTKLANKHPDKKHPMGHGRVEYLTAMIVAAIVLYAGITSGIESVKKIIHPAQTDYKTATLIVVGVAVAVKLILGQYTKSKGKSVNSGALVASGSDAFFDAVLSFSVLVCAMITIKTGVSLEAYVGLVISFFIIKSGIEMMTENTSEIVGRRADKELSLKIKEVINSEPEVRGAYDLLLNNYGPDRNYASVHVELPDTMTVEDVDILTRRLQRSVYEETGVILVGVGVYSYNTQPGEASDIRNKVQETVMSHDWALQLHGFYVDTEAKQMRFDVVMSFDVSHEQGLRILNEEIGALYPDYDIQIISDIDITD